MVPADKFTPKESFTSKHTENPFFFQNSLQRFKEKFGRDTWLRGGKRHFKRVIRKKKRLYLRKQNKEATISGGIL